MDLEPTEIKAIITRMKRANGHLASVIRMMEEGSDCESVLTQLAAVNKALADFASRGWLRLEPRSVVIMDVERLSRRAR